MNELERLFAESAEWHTAQARAKSRHKFTRDLMQVIVTLPFLAVLIVCLIAFL